MGRALSDERRTAGAAPRRAATRAKTGEIDVLVARRFAGMNRTLRITSGMASIGFGLLLVHRIGFVEGLFVTAR
ncbi:MAG: hypothetical protein ACJ772_13610 [Gemmatimonadaceae bacterium]